MGVNKRICLLNLNYNGWIIIIICWIKKNSLTFKIFFWLFPLIYKLCDMQQPLKLQEIIKTVLFLKSLNFDKLIHYRRKLCARCLGALFKTTADFDISVKKRDKAFLKIHLESLWNSTSSDAQQIFFWLPENNTAREELKKIQNFLKFSTSTSTFCMT